MRHPGGQEGLPQPDPDGAERQKELCLQCLLRSTKPCRLLPTQVHITSTGSEDCFGPSRLCVSPDMLNTEGGQDNPACAIAMSATLALC